MVKCYSLESDLPTSAPVVDYATVDEDVPCVVACNVTLHVEVGKSAIPGTALDSFEIGHGHTCCGEALVGE